MLPSHRAARRRFNTQTSRDAYSLSDIFLSVKHQRNIQVMWILQDVNIMYTNSRITKPPVPQMCSQEAVLRPGGSLPAVWRSSSWSEEPLPVSGPAGRREWAGRFTGARPDRRWDRTVAEQRRICGCREGKTCWEQEELASFRAHLNTFRCHWLETLHLLIDIISDEHPSLSSPSLNVENVQQKNTSR